MISSNNEVDCSHWNSVLKSLKEYDVAIYKRLQIYTRSIKIKYPDSRNDHGFHQPEALKSLPTYRWRNRHWMFKKFDEGIQLDEEGFLVATPEDVAAYISTEMLEFFAGSSVLEPFCGYGGQTISLAQNFRYVCGFDISLKALKMAKANLKVYGVSNADLILADVNNFNIKTTPEFDWVLISPPWTASYKNKAYDIFTVSNLSEILNRFTKFINNICLYVPPTQDLKPLFDVIASIFPSALVVMDYVKYYKYPKILVVYIMKLCLWFKKQAIMNQKISLYYIRTMNEDLKHIITFYYIISCYGIQHFLNLYDIALSKKHDFETNKDTQEVSRTLGGYFFNALKSCSIKEYREITKFHKRNLQHTNTFKLIFQSNKSKALKILESISENKATWMKNFSDYVKI